MPSRSITGPSATSTSLNGQVAYTVTEGVRTQLTHAEEFAGLPARVKLRKEE
jgi:hypothetical protein